MSKQLATKPAGQSAYQNDGGVPLASVNIGTIAAVERTAYQEGIAGAAQANQTLSDAMAALRKTLANSKPFANRCAKAGLTLPQGIASVMLADLSAAKVTRAAEVAAAAADAGITDREQLVVYTAAAMAGFYRAADAAKAVILPLVGGAQQASIRGSKHTESYRLIVGTAAKGATARAANKGKGKGKATAPTAPTATAPTATAPTAAEQSGADHPCHAVAALLAANPGIVWQLLRDGAIANAAAASAPERDKLRQRICTALASFAEDLNK